MQIVLPNLLLLTALLLLTTGCAESYYACRQHHSREACTMDTRRLR